MNAVTTPASAALTAGGPAPFGRRFVAALTGQAVAWTVGWAFVVALLISPIFQPSVFVVFGRTLFVAIVVLLAYTAAGQWQQARVPRWQVQLWAVVVSAPLATLAIYMLMTGGDFQAMFGPGRLAGMTVIGVCALVLGLMLGLGALFRERDAQANSQALAFALERETLQRQASDAQLALLQRQVEPHFLFNTLANVQALVESGSPRAAPVLASLIAYLRAAMPSLAEGAPTLGREERLVRAYLELMQLRMPDRLRWRIDIDPRLHGLRLPPMTLITLVENAVRHGIDPSETGGEIEVGARRDVASGCVQLWVADTGRGLDEAHAPGTGLANLRERLAAAYGAQALLSTSAVMPHGVRVDIELPANA